jgi:hypothetical protein
MYRLELIVGAGIKSTDWNSILWLELNQLAGIEYKGWNQNARARN